ncbi:MAG: signal peptide peptidase SppA [archaeon]
MAFLRKRIMTILLVMLGIFSLSLVFVLVSMKLPEVSTPKEIVLLRLEGTIGSAGALGGYAEIDRRRVRSILSELGDDPLVSAVVIEVSSPGGDAAGTLDLANSIRALAGKKPVVTFSTDVAASGGYWLLASGNRTIVSPLAIVGSIGVISETIDASKLLEKIGVNITTTKAGKYKDAGSLSKPLTFEEQEQFQELVDKVHEEFISGISEARGLSREELLNLSQGQVFLGRDAISLRLADSLGDEDSAIEEAKEISNCEACMVSEISIATDWERLVGQFAATFGRSFGLSFISGISTSSKV